MIDDPLFKCLINKKISNFIEKQLNGIWNFLDFYEAYCFTISCIDFKDILIEKKLRLVNYYHYGSYLESISLIKKKELSDAQYLIKVKNKAEELRKKSFIELKEYVKNDTKIISKLLLKFNEKEMKAEILRGFAGKNVIGVVDAEIED